MRTYLERETPHNAGDVCMWILDQSQFGNMSIVVKLALFLTLVPPTSVPVERGFSIRNQMKTLLKNRMRVVLLTALMIINTETGIELDRKIARRAAEIWLFEEGVKRRNLDSLKFEIEKEYETLMGEIREVGGNNYVKENEEGDWFDEEEENNTALNIVFTVEKLKNILKRMND
jgi:hypothetical protein